MNRGELRAVLITSVLVAVVVGVWLTASPTGVPAQGRPTPPASPAPAAGTHQGSLESLRVPDDVEAAEEVATSFATALLRDDLDALRDLATHDLARRLLTGRSHDPDPDDASPGVVIDGIVTEDLRPDRALFQVAVLRPAAGDGRLQTVTVSVVRDRDEWLVADTAF